MSGSWFVQAHHERIFQTETLLLFLVSFSESKFAHEFDIMV